MRVVGNDERALLIAVSGRVLAEARDICDQGGSVALPVLEEGDLDAADPGTAVLILAAGEGEEEQRTVRWRASLRRWSGERPSDGVPSMLDPAPRVGGERDGPGDDDDVTDEVRPVWIVVSGLRELEVRERIHTNELVRKRDRDARFFVPREPRLVAIPD